MSRCRLCCTRSFSLSLSTKNTATTTTNIIKRVINVTTTSINTCFPRGRFSSVPIEGRAVFRTCSNKIFKTPVGLGFFHETEAERFDSPHNPCYSHNSSYNKNNPSTEKWRTRSILQTGLKTTEIT